MTIRTRLTLWYSGVLVASLLLYAAASYYELIVERRRDIRESRRTDENSAPLALTTREEHWLMWEIGEIILLTGLPAVALGLLGGSLLTRKVLSPITTLTRTTEHISEQNLHARLKASGNGDELDRLTRVLNDMLARLDQAFHQVHEFTLHASHELKTPLTILHAGIETLLDDPACPPAWRDRLGDQLGEIQRLSRIVGGLTLLTKADAGLITLSRDPLPLDQLVQDSYADAQVLAQPDGIDVQLLSCPPTLVRGDAPRLRQLLLNLADNAVKYNRPGGRITLSLQSDGQMAEYTIANTGPGIPEQDRPHIFERFYRVRQHDIEGSGLGLSIVHWIISAHGGTIRLLTGKDGETIFVVRLPLA